MPDPAVYETRMIPSDPVLFRGIRDWLAGMARSEGFDDQAALEVAVAVNEACANIHRHAYSGREDGTIEFELEIRDATFSLTIRDYGDRFRPEACPSPDLGYPSEGGYGVFLIRKLMDGVEYTRKESGTELRLTKYRQGLRTAGKGKDHVGQAR